MSPLRVFTDGSSLGNPGPGGWAWWIDEQSWAVAGFPHSVTNNQMELSAVRHALDTIPAALPLCICLDSRYALDAITRWSHQWRRNGWRTSNGSPVANTELLQGILGLLPGRAVEWTWVKAHAGVHGNERADTKARQGAVRARDTGTPIQAGPGYTH